VTGVDEGCRELEIERTIRKDSIEEEDIGHGAGNAVIGTMEWKPPQGK